MTARDEWAEDDLFKDMEARSSDINRASLNPPFIEGVEEDAKLYAAFLKLVTKFHQAFSGEGEVTLFDGRKLMILMTQLAWRSMPTENNSYWSKNSHAGRIVFEREWMVPKAKWHCNKKATLYIARALVAQGLTIEEAKNKYAGPDYDYVVWPNNLIHVFDYT